MQVSKTVCVCARVYMCEGTENASGKRRIVVLCLTLLVALYEYQIIKLDITSKCRSVHDYRSDSVKTPLDNAFVTIKLCAQYIRRRVHSTDCILLLDYFITLKKMPRVREISLKKVNC